MVLTIYRRMEAYANAIYRCVLDLPLSFRVLNGSYLLASFPAIQLIGKTRKYLRIKPGKCLSGRCLFFVLSRQDHVIQFSSAVCLFWIVKNYENFSKVIFIAALNHYLVTYKSEVYYRFEYYVNVIIVFSTYFIRLVYYRWSFYSHSFSCVLIR